MSKTTVVDYVSEEVKEYLLGIHKSQQQEEKNRLALNPITQEEIDAMLVVTVGGRKYEGMTVAEVASADPSYLTFLCEQTDSYTERDQSTIKKCIYQVRKAEDDDAALESKTNVIAMEEIKEVLEMVIPFGQFKDQTIQVVKKVKPRYLSFLKSGNLFTPRQRRIIDLIAKPKRKVSTLQKKSAVVATPKRKRAKKQ